MSEDDYLLELEREIVAEQRKWKNKVKPMPLFTTLFWTVVAAMVTGTGIWWWLR